MRLSRDGETLLVGGYTTPVATRRRTVLAPPPPRRTAHRLVQGASLALDSVDDSTCPSTPASPKRST